MSWLDPLFRYFEERINPFAERRDYEPPNGLLAFVWHYVGQARWAFVALLAYGFANAIIEAALFAFVGEVVDILGAVEAAGAKGEGWTGVLATHGQLLLFMVLAVAVGRALVITFGALIEEQVIVPGFFTLMRWQSHKHVVGQSLAFFQNDLAGRIAQKVLQGGQAAGDMMISLLQIIWFIAVYAATTFGLLVALDFRLGLLIAFWIGVFALIARHYIPMIRERGRETAEAASVLSGRMVDGYANIATLKLHALAGGDSGFVREAMEIQFEALKRFSRALAGVRITLSAMSGLMIAALAALAIDLWLKSQISAGEVAFALALTLRLNLLLGRLMGNLNGFFRSVGTVQNTMELTARKIDLPDAPGARTAVYRQGRIELRDVSFDYGGPQVIERLNLTIAPGERVGLVGPSGAGKTTIVNLILRFFDIRQGQILFDGQDIRTVTQDSLRACFSLVQQDPALFNRTVRDNIAHGRPEASLSEVVAAAKRAHAHEFIVALKDAKGRAGYNARVGERGVRLSGGQRQRIAIAGVFLRNAPVLILDEAASQLDSEVEAAIRENLLELMAGKTVIAIAHRLSTIAELERLVVIDKGRIVQQGTHAQLLARGGLYARLWARQSGGVIAAAEPVK